MKQLNLSLLASLIAFTGAFISCNQSAQTTTEVVAVADSTTAQTPPAEKKTIAMVVSHHVKDYAAWRPFFDRDEPMRKAAGMTVLGIFQDAADPNYVSVTVAITNMEDAKQFAASEELKKVMTEAGVTDQPEVKFYEFQFSDDAAGNASDNRLFMVAKVPDYAAFEQVFAEHDSLRKARGISPVIIARNVDDATEIALAFTAADMAALKTHAGSAEVKSAMQQIGVIGEPFIQFATKAKEIPM